MNSQQFQVRRDQLTETRIVSGETRALDDGEILTRIDRFALTANNITYGVVGDKLGYWNFFPIDEGWGIIPVGASPTWSSPGMPTSTSVSGCTDTFPWVRILLCDRAV